MDIETFEQTTKKWIRYLKEVQSCLELYIQIFDVVYHTKVGTPGSTIMLYTDDYARTKRDCEALGWHFGSSNFGYKEDAPLFYIYEQVPAEAEE